MEYTERRRNQRQVTLMRVGLIHTSNGKDFCLVRNLSAKGLMARVYRRVEPGEGVQVELKSGFFLVGEVVWARGLEIGVQFRSDVDVEDVLSVQWDGQAALRPRLPRLDLNWSATVRQGAGLLDIEVRDISHRGAKIKLHSSVVRPGPVVLGLPHLPLIHGVVRWTREEEAGLAFNECLPFEMLARCFDKGGRPASSLTIIADSGTTGERVQTSATRVA